MIMPFVPLFLDAENAAASAAGGGFGMLIPLVLIVIIMYFFMIRPQNKKQKETEKMLAALKKGDKVVTIGGIHGTITSTKENTVVLKVDDNTKIEFNRSAISTVIVDKPAVSSEAQPEKKGLFGAGKKSRKSDKAGDKPAETPADDASENAGKADAAQESYPEKTESGENQ